MTGRESPPRNNPTATPPDKPGGRDAGRQPGFNDKAGQQGTDRYQVDRYQSPDQKDQGKVIARWLRDGKLSKGQSKVQYNQAVHKAKEAAERAVSEDRVPTRYHRAIKRYFDQLPTLPEKAEPAEDKEP